MALGLVLAAVDAAAAAPARSVEVRTALADGWVELTVADSGRAITEADRPQLFAPFSPLRRGGLGIGLFVARSIAEAHGGHVTAERPPAGALFRVVLPAQVSTGVAEPAPEAVRPSA
jgi:signal transduction histidine kinase